MKTMTIWVLSEVDHKDPSHGYASYEQAVEAMQRLIKEDQSKIDEDEKRDAGKLYPHIHKAREYSLSTLEVELLE